MIARITRKKSGLSKYLVTGKSNKSKYTRQEKDFVTPIHGNLQVFEQTENFLNTQKSYSDNYLHITLAFSKEDAKRVAILPPNERLQTYQDMVQDYLKHFTSGYEDEEVIAYAELHYPRVKEENGKERLPHIHLGIALYNPLDNTKLQVPFAKTIYMNSILQSRTNKKYNLTEPRAYKRTTKKMTSEMGLTRKKIIEDLRNITTKDELLDFFKKNKIEHKEVHTKNNHYFKILSKYTKDINLRGKGFEHIEKIISTTTQKDFKHSEEKSLEELNTILDNFYEKRKKDIYDRRSKKSKEITQKIKEEQKQTPTTLPDVNLSKEIAKKAQKKINQKKPKKIGERKTYLEFLLFQSERKPKQKPKPKPQTAETDEQRKNREKIKKIKEELSASIVLEYALQKYQIDRANFEIAEDNKINNKTNRQKPKNIIDFLQVECQLSSQKAIEICEMLFEEQKRKMEEENSFSYPYPTTQQKIFFEIYKMTIKKEELQGYFVKKEKDSVVKIENKKKNIRIEDKGDQISSISPKEKNLTEIIKIMINIALAKGWKLEKIGIRGGSKKFKEEAKKQIEKRIEERDALGLSSPTSPTTPKKPHTKKKSKSKLLKK